ncbi:MAG: hypothetical protein J7641_22905 [Cyanobacteria bacterium SID2]|nr:hypothetical protein [Cyanobacteria bacterium SID2]MBP0003972.1 hypothetical protein [Cyanobacteria bacterium SBC]
METIVVDIEIDWVVVEDMNILNQCKEKITYTHLRHFCSKSDLLPTLDIRIFNEFAIITSEHIYYAIAKDLRHTHIRALVRNYPSKQNLSDFLKQPYVRLVDWKLLLEESHEEFISYMWFVFFFETALNTEQKIIFEKEIVGFFERVEMPRGIEVPLDRIKDLNYPYSQRCAEFQAYLPIPLGGERWIYDSMAKLLNFHKNHVPIVSFQGVPIRNILPGIDSE